ncbi:MAG TPA: hypothetical protein VD963_10020, partial [Phycisphaerales bacterium]|nr:hypothetical protein [Phycisphaerales bacterium]
MPRSSLSPGARTAGRQGLAPRDAVRAAVVALAALVGAPTRLAAALAAPAQPPTAPGELSGRHFAGLELGESVVAGEIVLGAQRAAVWTEDSTQRLVLWGDVRVTLGIFEFAAARAVVWVERIGVAEHDQSLDVYQVAVYFDRLSDPVAEAGIAQHAD